MALADPHRCEADACTPEGEALGCSGHLAVPPPRPVLRCHSVLTTQYRPSPGCRTLCIFLGTLSTIVKGCASDQRLSSVSWQVISRQRRLECASVREERGRLVSNHTNTKPRADRRRRWWS